AGGPRLAAALRQRGLGASDAGVESFRGLDRGVEHAGMAAHVAVGVVDDDDVVALLLDGLDDTVGDLRRAHLWLQVVGRNLRRGNQNALLPFEGLLAAAGVQEGHAGILYRCGDTPLRLALPRQVPANHPG